MDMHVDMDIREESFIVYNGSYEEYADVVSAMEIYTGIYSMLCDALKLLMPDCWGIMFS